MKAVAHLPFSTYRLDRALLIYKRASSGSQDNARREDRVQPPQAFVSVHDVEASEQGQPVLGVGRPATAEGARMLARDLLGQKPPGLIPPRVLAVGETGCSWYVPAGKREMYFHSKSEDLRAASGEAVAHPGLVFAVDNRRGASMLRVFAFRKRGRPSLAARLYQAPFLNVSSNGSVCLGSTAVPGVTDPAAAPAWTEAFFASAFSHANAQVLRPNGPTYGATVRELAESGDPFPGHRLIRLRIRLSDVLGV